jgi:REP element-mobilizing transposase RayT
MLGEGVQSRRLFRDERDHLHFLKRLGERVETYGVRLFAHCEMLTHYHLLLETPRANLGRFMHSLNTAYTLCYNLRHRRKGPLVQGRHGAKLVEGDNYLLSLSRYIRLNPVHIKSIEKQSPADQRRHLHSYRWSSYRAYMGREKAPEWLEPLPILSQCGSKRGDQRKAYRAFVEGSMQERDEDLLDALSGTWPGIGDETFLGWVKEQYIEQAQSINR